MPSFLKIPKIQLALTLFVIYLSSLIGSNLKSSFYILSLCVGFAIFFDLLFTFLRRKTLFLPLSAIVTGLIIVLIIDPKALWYQIAAVCALAVGSKNFIRIGDRHIFNPAAAGLFLAGVIFNLNISWWGVSGNLFPFFIILLPGLVSFWRMRRFGSILSFLLIYSVFNPALLLDRTTIFFSLVMLPEPMTSPFNLKKQVFYGAIVAAITPILSHFPVFPDILIPALLLGNLFNFFFK